MTSSNQLVELVSEFVDKRTTFGNQAIDRAAVLAGPQITALYELIQQIKSKGITKINGPLQFKLVGYEKGDKFETVGKSIASPNLRTAFRYSLSVTGTTSSARAGQVAGVGQVGSLGEIEVGKILNAKLPILMPVLGDNRYIEFFQESGRENRSEEVSEIHRRTMQEVIQEQFGKTGFDTSEFSAHLRDYFEQAAWTSRGNDLLWLERQIYAGNIEDGNLSFAFYDVMMNPEYSNESAQQISHAVIELRKRSTKGLIGKLKDDLLYLDENPGIYDVDLNQPLTRRTYYPDRETIEEGTIREKLDQAQLTFSEALGIVRSFPGIVNARKQFNRTNAEVYFGEGQKAVAGILSALEDIRPSLEEDKKTYHKAKSESKQANLKLGKSYKLAKTADELATLDRTKGDFANIAFFTGFKDSRRLFSGLYTLDNQLRLAESYEDKIRFAGVMNSKYINYIDFEEKHGLSLEEFVKRVEDVKEILTKPTTNPKSSTKKRKSPVTRRKDKQYEKFRQDIERLTNDSEFNLVSVDFENQLAKYGPVLRRYKESKGANKKDLDRLVRFADVFDLTDLATDYNFREYSNRTYLSDEEIQGFQSIRERLKSVVDFTGLNLRDVTKYERLRKKFEEKLDKSGSEKPVYDCKKGSLKPSSYSFLSAYSKKEDFRYLDPREIESRAKFVDKCKTSAELGEEFLSKLQAISEHSNQRTLKNNRSYKVNKAVIDRIIDQYKSRPEGILLTNGFVAEVERGYERLWDLKNLLSLRVNSKSILYLQYYL